MNIIMSLIIRGLISEEAVAQCQEIVKLLGIDNRLEHKLNEFPMDKGSVETVSGAERYGQYYCDNSL